MEAGQPAALQVQRDVSKSCFPNLLTTTMIMRVMMTMVKSLMMITCSHLWHTSMATPNSDQVKKRKI